MSVTALLRVFMKSGSTLSKAQEAIRAIERVSSEITEKQAFLYRLISDFLRLFCTEDHVAHANSHVNLVDGLFIPRPCS